MACFNAVYLIYRVWLRSNFLQENQKAVKSGARLACVPCGMMGELLYLDFSKTDNVELTGIDLDSQALEDAKSLALKSCVASKIKLIKADAWQISINNEFDLISSNGLTIYEPDDDKVTALYAIFYRAIIPGGKLVTSFLTYPPTFPDKTEWIMKSVQPKKLLLQRIVFSDILKSKFMFFRTTKQTKEQLKSVGFKDVTVIQDSANIFPTIVATK